MTIRYIFLAVEFVLLTLFLVPFPIFCSGNIAGIIVSICLMVMTAWWDKFCSLIVNIWTSTGGKIGLVAIALVVVVGIVYIISLSVLMVKAQENRPEKPEIIVVLGCKVNGETPSRMLRRRLDATIVELKKYPDVMCVVSGGQGDNEKVTEASAMKKYLIEKGIDESRIILEDKSESTYENIKFTLEKLDEHNLSHNLTIVTDGFHEYRASLITQAQGVENVYSCPAYTEPRFLFTYWVREWLGITHFFVFGN